MKEYASEEILKMRTGMITHCSKGYSIASYLSKLEMSYRDFNDLCQRHEILGEGYEIAQAKELYYWENKMLEMMRAGEQSMANICKSMLAERVGLYEKVYKRNILTQTPTDMIRKRIGLTRGDGSADALDDMR